MCGIVGYTGQRPVVRLLLKGLKRLEYRGYDSAGVAFFNHGKIEVKKSEGRLENVEKLLNGDLHLYEGATCGIGHTRWATHGKPTTQNAHPHRTGPIVLVHNGIIENYQNIRQEVLRLGYKPESETDSELYGYLVLEQLKKGFRLFEAVRRSFLELKGSCSVVVLSQDEPGVVIGVRNGSPLVAATDPLGGAFLASDSQPLLEYTEKVYFLEHGDIVLGTEKGLEFFDLKTGHSIQRESVKLDWSNEQLDKQGFAHYMLKEIHEEPNAFVDTLNFILDRAQATAFPLARQPAVDLLNSAQEIHLIACGTSYYACLLGKYWIEKWAKIPVQVELASEFRYRNPVLKPGALIVGVSQSGETADTMAVIRDMNRLKVPTLGLTNVRGSQLSREANAVFYTSAGPEVGVAATKTFFTQMLVFLLWAGHLGLRNQNPVAELFDGIVKLPHLLKDFLNPDTPLFSDIKNAAKAFLKSRGFFFIGRGYSYPMALEGALKLKEISYIHAEGYAGGELKHGPIAMIDEEMVVVVLAPMDRWREKTLSNLEEVRARGALILGVGTEGDQSLRSLSHHFIALPSNILEDLIPFFIAPVVQLFSYELALLKGTDVDKPRNLAKSVTVE